MSRSASDHKAVTMTRKKPVELHLIRGNSSKQRFTSSPLRPALRDAPFEPPDYLTIEARDEWLRLSGPLHELGLLTSLNVSVFAAYCTTYAKWRADRVLAGARGGAGHESPTGNSVVGPLQEISAQCARDLTRYAAQLGLSPTGRLHLIGSAAATT